MLWTPANLVVPIPNNVFSIAVVKHVINSNNVMIPTRFTALRELRGCGVDGPLAMAGRYRRRNRVLRSTAEASEVPFSHAHPLPTGLIHQAISVKSSFPRSLVKRLLAVGTLDQASWPFNRGTERV